MLPLLIMSCGDLDGSALFVLHMSRRRIDRLMIRLTAIGTITITIKLSARSQGSGAKVY